MTDRTLAEILSDEAKHADDTFARYVRMYDTAKEAIRARVEGKQESATGTTTTTTTNENGDDDEAGKS